MTSEPGASPPEGWWYGSDGRWHPPVQPRPITGDSNVPFLVALAYLSIFACPVVVPAAIWLGSDRTSIVLRRHCIRASLVQAAELIIVILVDGWEFFHSGSPVNAPALITEFAAIVVCVVFAVLGWKQARASLHPV